VRFIIDEKIAEVKYSFGKSWRAELGVCLDYWQEQSAPRKIAFDHGAVVDVLNAILDKL